jgi:hypothetical protein
MNRLLMIFVLAAQCLWPSTFAVNAPQSLTQSKLNEYDVGPGEAIKTVGVIKNLSDEELLETVQRQTFQVFLALCASEQRHGEGEKQYG